MVVTSVPLSGSSGRRKGPGVFNDGHYTTGESTLNNPEGAILDALTPRAGRIPVYSTTGAARGGAVRRRVLETTFAAEVGVTNVTSLSM